MKINTKIDKGGVLPLRICNSGETTLQGKMMAAPGYPAFLEVEAVVPLYYRVDDKPPVFWAGDKKLYIAPIHGEMGFGAARVIGMAPQADATFVGRVGTVDLTGDWMMGDITINDMTNTCEGDMDPAQQDMDVVLSLMAEYGTYITLTRPGSDGPGSKMCLSMKVHRKD